MKLLSLLKELSLHPKNAEELKGLILQLAVEGKLTANWREDNPNVESASELLKQIETKKDLLIKEKKIKKSKPLDVISDDEKYFHIPETWIWERLGNVGNIFNGNSVNKAIKEAKYTGLKEGYPYIGTKDVGYGFESINDDNGVKIPHDEPKFKIANKGTVLICSEGGSAGKKMGMLPQACCFGNKLYAIEQFGEIESVYILGLYGSPAFSNAFQEKMSGIIGGISRSNFIDLLIPLPPIEEQKAIVELVKQLFTEVEQIEELTKERISLKEDFVTSALRKLTESENTTQEWNFLQEHFSSFFTEKLNVKKLRETILQLAVQGKLTAKWREANPSVEHASELLKRIEAEKQQLITEKKIKKEKPLPPIEEEDKPYDLPKSWTWCRWVDLLGAVYYPMKRGPFGSSLRKADFVEKGIRVFEQYNPINDDPDWMRYFITESKYESMKAFTTTAGDFLISCSGATLGRIVYLPEGTMSGIINQALLKLTLSHEVIKPDYFLKLFRSQYIQEIIWGNAKGMAQPNMVGVKELKQILIPLPPMEEQISILQKVNSLMALCDELEQQIDNSQTQIEHLMQSCLKEVFDTCV